MNKKAYRIVFNAHRGALMVVAENGSGDRGNGARGAVDAAGAEPLRPARSMRLAQVAVFVCALFGGVTVVSAQIVADRNAATRPVVDQSANGLPVVQIVTPNAAGVSHNRYDQFNVARGGAILNNATTYTQTQQAGYIAANAALVAGSARVILNEVTGASRSQLNGFIEVAGQRAEVIVANPNGISCSNCGFINTSRGTLTTGSPEFAGDGSVANLRVTRGDISIGSGGMNASSLDQVDLIARSVQVNGELWGKQLNVISGANLVSYANLGVQVIGGQGTQPTVGIDLAQMGGMYANRIRLVGTESGVGVRSMGNIAAQAGDINIDSRGMLTLGGSTTASGNIAIAGESNVANSGNLYAGQAARINAAGALDNTGVIAARTDVTVQAHDIKSSNSIAAGIDASGNAANNGNLTLTAATDIDNTGGNLYAKDNLLLRAGANLSNVNGVIHSDGNLDVAASGALKNNGGRIEAGGSAATFDLAAASIDNSDGKIANSGSGLTQIDGGAQILNANNARVANTGVIGGNGDVKLTSQAINNGQGAQVLVGNDLSLQVASLDNQGDISATRDLNVNVTNGFTSTDTSSLSAVRNLNLTANSVDNNGLINSGATTVVRAATSLHNTGKIYGEDIALGGQNFTNNVNTATNVAGVVAARNSVQIGADQVTNSEHALLQSLGDMTIAGALDGNNQATGSATSIINESATIDAGGALSLQTATLINRNNHFSTTLQDDAALTRYVTQYANWAAPNTWYDANQVSWSDSGGGGIVLVIPDGNRFEQFYKRDYVEVVQKTVVLSSDPGRISSGGNMLLSGSVTNDKSVMIAGGTLSGSVGAIDNIGATGTQTTIWHMTAGQNYYHWVSGHPHTNYYTYNNGGAAYDNVMASATLDLPVASVQQNATPAGISNPALSAGAPGGTGVGAGGLPHFSIPNSGLFTVRNQPGQNYLIETDPKFTDYKTFISSDYMLGRMTLDPQITQKRLGDGFYEQKLITDQVAELTGKRMLDGYVSAEDQYKALMDSGVASASRFQLTPGIALSDAQIAALTSDIVWLVEQDVKLPDGTTTKALTPVVYLSRASTEDIKPAGTLIAGKDIDLKVSGTLDNGGILLASNNSVVQATDIHNTGSIASSSTTGSVALTATNDVESSGNISGNRVGILAGRDVNLVTTTASNMTHDGLNTKVDQVSSVNAGQLAIQAGRDINAVAASVQSSGDAVLVANRDINLGTVKTRDSYDVTFDSQNHLYTSNTQVAGSSIGTTGALTMSAGQDINAQAAYANSGGALVAAAGRNIDLGAAQQETTVDQAIYTTSKGLLSSSSSRSQRDIATTTSVGTTFSGDSVQIAAGNDLTVTGSNVVGTNDVTLAANNNVNIVTSKDTNNNRFQSEEKTSGLFSGGSFGVTMGSKSLETEQASKQVTNNASTVGSTGGSISIVAGNGYSQLGSNVMAPSGDISILAKKVDILAAYDTQASTQDMVFKQSGLTLQITSPIISAIQTAQQMKKAAESTSDSRMQLLAAANVGFAANNAVDAVKAGQGVAVAGKDNPQILTNAKNEDGTLKTNADGTPETRDATAADQAGGINLAISIGGSKSESHSAQSASTVRGSAVAAGGNVTIAAQGGGTDSNIVVQGSDIKAGGNTTLKADNAVQLLAAQSTTEQHSSNKAMSGSIGISIGTDGLLLNAGLSGSRGRGDGNDVTQTVTHVDAGNTLSITSGTDTTLSGAVASGKQVVMDVGTSGSGNLNIASLQDTSTYKSNQQSLGVSVSFGMGKMSGSLSASRSSVDGNYASVIEQSGINAGDGGFQINVAGNTALKGAKISSTEKAVAEGKNSFITDTLIQSDIQNRSDYKAESQSIGVGTGYSGSNFSMNGAGFGMGGASGSQSSVTTSGISGIAGDTSVRSDKDSSGKISKDWDGQQLQNDVVAQAQITQMFSKEAGKSIASYSAGERERLKEEIKKAKTDEEKNALQQEIKDITMQERALNALVGFVTGMGTMALTKEGISTVADKMRDWTIEDSMKFPGVIDGDVVLSNQSGPSGGIRGDDFKAGGVRVDLDAVCGVTNERCKTQYDTDGAQILDERGIPKLALDAYGRVQFDSKAADMSLTAFLDKHPDAQLMVGPTGGIQGSKGTLFGAPYAPGSWQDKLIESFAGSHDMLGGKWSGLYDDQGNIKRNMTDLERKIYDNAVTTTALLPATPLALSEFLSPALWNAVVTALKMGIK
ncbi:hemagglutinin repeat-containing protein [Herbaspirillum sp. alder98]|uniref:two-partner secretion domain-containing protein n=1 Tax=Herbaspirillum sp. alder98 TaxID=2913096 RepID=UPI001CD82852|nr:hemagglutinin repeat-containing protein [Herbaspirillum sp. alder98]MCA1323681.1 hemagglutinin repeat-containing protein [Herbaspirillum sp. alder98]